MAKVNGSAVQRALQRWRYYTLGREQYKEYIKRASLDNLHNLRLANTMVAVLAFGFMLFPMLVEKNSNKAGVYFGTAVIAMILAVFAHYWFSQCRQGKQITDWHIYLLTTAYYVNFILFGIYLGVWGSRSGPAVVFMIFLICAFLLFINSPLYELLCTLGVMAIFMASSILLKEEPHDWMVDVVNAVIAGSISLFVNWRSTMLRLVSALNTSRLEEERNSYYAQSTIDELTRLKNRRDFTQTFQRRLTNYRSTDDWLCIAIMDIDYFKNYNDHYGHPMGDECLRAIGTLLNNLRESMGLYAARVGGEEFALIWYEKDPSLITNTVSQIQQMIHDLNIPHKKSKVGPYITVSIGIHTIRCGASDDMHALYDLADKALYTAKRNGRNRAIIYSDLIG